MDADGRKIFAGPKIRRLRRGLGLTQSRMALDLGFSASYLNLVERNQRPVSAQLLLRLAENYDVDLRSLAGDDEARAFVTLNEILADPMFKSLDMSKRDIQELANAPGNTIEAVSLLYSAYRESRERLQEISSRIAERDSDVVNDTGVLAIDVVRDFIHTEKNYFPELDEAAETLNEQMNLARDDAYGDLKRRIEREHGLRVRFVPMSVMPDALRHFDRHRKQLLLSEMLPRSGRVFQLAFYVGLLEFLPVIERTLKRASLANEEAESLARITLANYFAAALVMPYRAFLKDVQDLQYDVEHLSQRYGASFEQVCHRLTTLQRPGAKGIPFFFVRVDNAGNVSKRFSAGSFHFSRYGGTCPLWNVHDTFAKPGRILTQIIAMPDDTTYFSIARTVQRATTPYHVARQRLAIGLGCELKYAPELTYAKGHDLENPDAVPVGPNCRLCERPNCAQRAHPPITRKMVLDERFRGISPYTFSME